MVRVIVHLITDDPDRSAEILADRGFLVTRTQVLSVKLANRPAGLMRAARQLAAHASSPRASSPRASSPRTPARRARHQYRLRLRQRRAGRTHGDPAQGR